MRDRRKGRVVYAAADHAVGRQSRGRFR
jgi:hypothetical protein